MKNERAVFDGVGAFQGRHVAGSSVHGENCSPAVGGRDCGRFPANNLKDGAVELDGDGLRGCGHPQKEEDDRNAGKLSFNKVTLLRAARWFAGSAVRQALRAHRTGP